MIKVEPSGNHDDMAMSSGPKGLLSMFLSVQFLKFLLVGGGAAAIHWLARFLLTPAFGYVVALVIAYAIGIATGYVLNAIFVFSEAKNRRREQIVYFVTFNLLMAPVVIGIAYVLSEFAFPAAGWSYNPRGIAHAVGVASPIFVSFLLHKFYTFKGG